MAKRKLSSTIKKTTLKRIDNIPKCSQQRRSSPPKRRTDFSLFFFCNSDSLPNSGSLLESSCVKIALFNKTLNSLCVGESGGKELLVRCSKSFDEGSRFSSNAVESSTVEVELVKKDALLESSGDSKVGEFENEVFEILDFTPKNSQVADNKGLSVSPSSVVSKRCWSAENLSHISSEGLVKRTASFNHTDEQDLSSNKSNSPVSSRTDGDSVERGRGKRERKPKIHFGDCVMPLKSDRSVRRLRIMRYLGLTPPVGSPF